MKQVLIVLLAVSYTTANAAISITEKCSTTEPFNNMPYSNVATLNQSFANDSGYINSNCLHQPQKKYQSLPSKKIKNILDSIPKNLNG